MKTISRFLLGVLVMVAFSGIAYAGNTAGVFRLPFDPNQHWLCGGIGYWNDPPSNGQNFMNLNTVFTIPKYHFVEDWNGKCGGSTDLGAVLYAIADGFVEAVDDISGTDSKGFGKLRRKAYDFQRGMLLTLFYQT